MSILVFKTDLSTMERINLIRPIFNLHPLIIEWHVDVEDIDNVLRIESSNNLSESDIISLLRIYGIQSEALKN